ncbi:MAG: glycosyltransferase family 4 protein [Gammaproteobacteria bacterium]
MRICHFLSSDTYAGIEQHVDEISKGQSHNHQVIIITNRSILQRFNNNVSKISFSSIGRNSPIGLLRLFFLIKEISPDIIHTHAAKPTFMINKIKKLFNAKHVATIHGAKKNLDEFDKADFITVGNATYLDKLKSKNKLVISNWALDPISYDPGSRKEYFLAIGRLVKEKGFDILINAWKDIDEKLIILGSGRLKKNLLKQIKDTSQESKIFIEDSVSKNDIDEFYSRAKMLIISSRREGGPRVALEALFRGIKVISTKVGHMPDVLDEAYLCNPDSLDSLSNLLKDSINKISTIDQSPAFEKVRTDFTFSKANKSLLSIYTNLLNPDIS